MASVKVVHFSDILCVWAYIGESNLFELARQFGTQLEVEVHFCSVFPDTQTKINKGWRDRGGFAGYADHVRGVAARFKDVPVHADTWQSVQPRSSASPHLFVKAVELLEPEANPGQPPVAFADRLSVRAATELRQAFFAEAQDIANWKVQRQIAETIGLDFANVLGKIETGEAIAKLAADYELAQSLAVQGSPTYILNEGRQRLFGDIGHRILAANVGELLGNQPGEAASLCR